MIEVSRLNRYVALSLGVSRREADELIASGAVQINNQVAGLGARVTDGDTVTLNGEAIAPQEYQYYALHKPAGYVCSRKRQGDTPTIYELLPQDMHQLKPVGRLDKDSSGIILLTNDGEFAHQMMHPSFHKQKVYQVTLDADLQPLHRQMISDFGVMLEDGKSQFELARKDESDERSWVITMSEGRNRQIRRTFAALGYTVTGLHRTTFGKYTLDTLAAGKFIPVETVAS